MNADVLVAFTRGIPQNGIFGRNNLTIINGIDLKLPAQLGPRFKLGLKIEYRQANERVDQSGLQTEEGMDYQIC